MPKLTVPPNEYTQRYETYRNEQLNKIITIVEGQKPSEMPAIPDIPDDDHIKSLADGQIAAAFPSQKQEILNAVPEGLTLQDVKDALPALDSGAGYFKIGTHLIQLLSVRSVVRFNNPWVGYVWTFAQAYPSTPVVLATIYKDVDDAVGYTAGVKLTHASGFKVTIAIRDTGIYNDYTNFKVAALAIN